MNAFESIRVAVEDAISAVQRLETLGLATPEKVKKIQDETIRQIIKPRLTAAEAADMLGVSVRTVRRWKRDGTLECESDPATNRVYFVHASVLKYRAQAS